MRKFGRLESKLLGIRNKIQVKTLTIILHNQIGVARGPNTVDDNEDRVTAGRLALESQET